MAAVTPTAHALERQAERAFDDAELHEIVGDDEAPRASGSAPEPGSPVCIGVQAPEPGRDRRKVILGLTTAGRYGIAVVAHPRNGPQRVLTIFDPAENPDLWRPDFMGPTAAGVRSMPPTTWHSPSTFR